MSEIIQAPIKRRYDRFNLITNRLDVQCELPVEIVPGISLVRASMPQIAHLRGILPRTLTGGMEMWFEIHETRAESGARTNYTKMPPNRWRYFGLVVSTPGADAPALDLLLQVSALGDVELTSHYSIDHKPDANPQPAGWGRRGMHDPIAETTFDFPPLEVFTDATVAQLKALYVTFRSVKDRFPDLNRAVSMFEALRALRFHDELRTLGLFAIIELLITHDPHTDHDGLTHQVSRKIPLLNRRLENGLDYGAFGEAPETTIWKALYAYRSAIAHGGIFPSKSAGLLRDQATAQSFLRQATKALLRHALKEPELVADLKQC